MLAAGCPTPSSRKLGSPHYGSWHEIGALWSPSASPTSGVSCDFQQSLTTARRMMTMADPVDLDVLDRYLLSDEAADNGMALSDLDGFLTGILVGPELIMPSEWLPHI